MRLALFLRSSIEAQITVIPDDAFYYAVPAHNFALSGQWTFDGQAPATGFHLLYGYLLAGLFRLAPDLSDPALFALLGGASTLLLALSAYLVARAAVRDFGPQAALGVVVAFSAPIALLQQTLFVESCLVIAFSSALVALLSHAAELPRASPRWLAGALALGFLGNLARSDFGLLSAACAAVFFALRRRPQADLAAAAALGSLGGIALVSLHTWAWSGSFVQSSARMKGHWGALLGYDVRGFLRPLVDWLAPRDAGWLGRAGPPVLALVGVVGAVSRLGTGALRVTQWPLALGCALSLVGYVLFYGNTSAGVPPWYLANALAGLGYLLGALTSFVPRRLFVPALTLAAVCAALDTAASLRPMWPNQVAMHAGGEYLRAHPEIGPVGAWNAGILSHFSRRRVVNLDGLVNDEIYDYATTGRLLDYVCARKLRFVLDFRVNVEDPAVSRRGGYADGRLRSGLVEVENFSHGDPDRQWAKTDLVLYRVDESLCPAPVTRP